jgi:hypothetical protein
VKRYNVSSIFYEMKKAQLSC